MTPRQILAQPLARRQVLRRMAVTASGLAIGPWLAGCGDGATPATDLAVPLAVDPNVPWWMQNNFQPVSTEVEAFDLSIDGSLPPELNGLYVRNGSNAQAGVTSHWFLGDGMLHGIRLEGGRASWYRNRWVRTPLFTGRTDFTEAGPPIGGNNQSNVSVIFHGGKLLSSGEVGSAYHIDHRTLDTIGVEDFDGSVGTSFTAHAKIDPATGNMHFFGYWFAPPYLTYHVANPAGDVIHSAEIDLPAAPMMHSFAITDRDAIFYDLPVVFTPSAAAQGGFPYAWSDEHPARIGVLPLGGTNDQIRWVEIEPCYVFHELNAFREGDDVVVDVCRFERMMDGERFGDVEQNFRRWRVDTGSADLRFRDEILMERDLDFTMHDRRYTGRRTRHGWLTTFRPHPDTVETGGILHLDVQSGRTLGEWDPGPNGHVGEPLFVPGGPGEGEGWLMTYTYDHARNASSFIVLDAQNVARGPIAEIALPQRVPYGFHGTWVPDDTSS